jgi:hypothetical protein
MDILDVKYRDINQNRILRNVNNLLVWNAESERKFIPSLKVYSKQWKMALLATITA